MRTIRLILSGAVLLSLLAMTGAPVGAQEDTSAATAATGTLTFVAPEPETATGGDVTTHEEETLHVHEWTSSDPRLTGTATYTGSWHLYNPPAEDCDDPDATAGTVYEIVNVGGGWRCGGFRAPVPGPDGANNVHMLVFRGTGGYEGLSAYILIDWSASPFAFSALITPEGTPIGPVLEG